MLGIVGLVGGVLEIRRARKAKQNRAKLEKELKQMIEQYAAQTEQQRRAAADATRAAARLEAEGARLKLDAAGSRAAAESLTAERGQLAAANTDLARGNAALGRQAEALAGEMRELSLVHGRLTDEVASLSAARAADAERGAAELSALRAAAARVLTRLLEGDIDERAAVDELRALACEVEFVAAADEGEGEGAAADASSSGACPASSAPPPLFEGRLILDDPARLARLVRAARSTSSSGSLTPRSAGGGDAAQRLALSWREERLVVAAAAAAGSGRSGLGRASGSSGGGSGSSGADANSTMPDALPKQGGREVSSPARKVASARHGKAAAAGSLASEAADGKLVFSPQPKRGLQQQAPRTGVVLLDAAAMFGGVTSDAHAVADARGA